ncbi:MAG: endonuclease MutS2, partial [Candidatus Tectomicrobia bacterium]|nr:endonuclease MutS2 [Candidatus Tectomicrobia bacterium]
MSERSREALEWPKLKEKLAELATSSLGQGLCIQLPLWEDETTVSQKLQETTEFKRVLEEEDAVPMGGIHNLQHPLERARKGAVLEPRELLAVSDTLRASSRLKTYFYQRREYYPLLFRLTQPLADLRGLERTISSCFDAGGEVSDEASPVLRHLRREVRLLHQQIKDRLTSLINAPAYVHFLQEHYYTQRENRYVVLIKAEARNKVPGIVHDTSLSGATVFIEPQDLVEINNQLKMAELEVEREIYRILRELSSLVVDHALEISANLEVLGELDLTYSKARLSQLLEAGAPRVSSRHRVDLLSARHPLMVLSQKDVVPNSIRLDQEGQALIVTGPNAGGKTIALKTLGLCALMVKAGLHIPAAPGSEMPLFSEIYADIGDQQSVESDLSTFSAHLLQILEILHRAGPTTLVLLDEIATATDPDEGAALAQAILERLVEQGALTMATTHYGRLKALASQDARFVNASLEFHRADLRPTYRLIQGTPGRSFGMEIARRLGLSAEVYERAKELLGGEQEGLNRLLEDLE